MKLYADDVPIHRSTQSKTKPFGDASITRSASPFAANLSSKTTVSSSSPNSVAGNSSVKDRIARFQSAPQLPKMSSNSTEKPQQPPTPSNAQAPSPAPPVSRTPSNQSIHHPDLSEEVASLSAKLVESLNHQTSIDDNLQTAQQDLAAARAKIAQLEAAAEEHADLISQGLLVKKSDVETIEQKIKGEVEAERDLRVVAEKQKKRIELELETLTQSLFEEANGMVAQARKQREASERRNDQLRRQLNDAELLLASHQEQLHDLKGTLEQLQTERDQADNTRPSTAPGTPMNVNHNIKSQDIESRPDLQIDITSPDSSTEQPLHFSNLIHPVLRSDLQVYDEFVSLLKTSKNPLPTSRVQSGTFGSLHVMGLGSLTSSNKETSAVKPAQQGTSASSSALSASNPGSPTPTGGFGDSTQEAAAALASLKENKFYKRALTEDIEPTLRLDLAPGLSWLAKRTVLNSMTIGSLVVEPFPQTSRVYGAAFACAMCGESRRTEHYARRHRFRASEAEDAQRYPLCDYCVARVRSSCDYIGFLRMVKNGHWRSETEDDQNAAWEESVRLRERMFWARIGGGVVPSAQGTPASATFLTPGPQSPSQIRPVPPPPLNRPPTSNPEQLSKPGTQSGTRTESFQREGSPNGPGHGGNPGDDAQRDDESTTQLDTDATAEEARIEAETAEQLRNNVHAAIALKRGSRVDNASPARSK